MGVLEVRVPGSASDTNGGRVYRATGSEPQFLEFDPNGSSDGAGRYQAILDLPEGNPGGAPASQWIFVVGIDLEAGHEQDFEDWYNIEHLPALVAVPGVKRASRYRLDGDDSVGPRYLALYEVESPDIPGNAAWQTAVNTPWTERMRNHFKARWRGGYELQADNV